jgi:hypothetical protein
MKTRNWMSIKYLLAAACIAAGTLAAAPRDIVRGPAVCQSEDGNFHAEASTLLEEVQSASARLSQDAAILQSYTRTGVSRESHKSQLNALKDHINSIGERLARLQAIRHVAAPWHQQAIDSVAPVAANLASKTTAAIQHVNRNNVLWAPDYADLLREISSNSSRLKDTVDVHLDMADTQNRLEQLRDRANTLGS